MSDPLVIVGGGQAAGTTVSELREQGYDGDVVVLTEEAHPPYERPPLSKEYLMGSKAAEETHVQDPAWYADHGVELRRQSQVTAIDPGRRTLTADGRDLSWSGLLLATGARPRRLRAADESGVPVTYLRTLDDATALREQLQPGRRVAIIGGGWIGLEVAAAARNAGTDVVLLEALDLPLQGVLGARVAGSLTELHREHGVDVRTGAVVSGIGPGDHGVRVFTGDGTVEADHLVVGVGVVPATGLAEAAGLAVDNGILVDDHLRTSAPGVYAAGDVANVEHPVLGRRVRVEHWDTALQHGTVAAVNLAGGDAAVEQQPFFFSDQYDLGLEYVGHAPPGEVDRTIVRGSLEGDRVFTAFWLAGDRVLAGMHANDWGATDHLRRLAGRRVDPELLADTATALADVTAR